MPYIQQDRRHDLDEFLQHAAAEIESDGELNYAITSLVDLALGPRLSYASLNAAIGVLECAKLELYRRLVAEYEDGKCRANGDVYGPRK